jgi:hypothetical protein
MKNDFFGKKEQGGKVLQVRDSVCHCHTHHNCIKQGLLPESLRE